MMTHIEKIILAAEEKWKASLHKWCKSNFNNQLLPSHDESHHERVWFFIKEILYALAYSLNIRFNNNFIEALIISSYFHDSGMKYTKNEKHGKIGRDLCETYFTENSYEKPKYFDEILEAIQYHDDKNNYQPKPLSPDSIKLLPLLSLADDLDAFGHIGILRYAEIYLMRGIKKETLPARVLTNASSRFMNLGVVCRKVPNFVGKHKSRYTVLKKFFQSINIISEYSLISRSLERD